MGKHFIRLTVLVKFYEISTTFFMPADTVLVRLFYFIFFCSFAYQIYRCN